MTIRVALNHKTSYRYDRPVTLSPHVVRLRPSPHPGGRSHDDFPVNANAAESRRISRFRPYSHSIGPVKPPPEEPHSDHPYTLDLRYRPGC